MVFIMTDTSGNKKKSLK